MFVNNTNICYCGDALNIPNRQITIKITRETLKYTVKCKKKHNVHFADKYRNTNSICVFGLACKNHCDKYTSSNLHNISIECVCRNKMRRFAYIKLQQTCIFVSTKFVNMYWNGRSGTVYIIRIIRKCDYQNVNCQTICPAHHIGCFCFGL